MDRMGETRIEATLATPEELLAMLEAVRAVSRGDWRAQIYGSWSALDFSGAAYGRA